MSKSTSSTKKGGIIFVDEHLELRWSNPAFAKEVFAEVDRSREHLRSWLYWVDDTQTAEDSYRFLREAALFNEGGQRFSTFIFYHGKVAGSIGFVTLNKRDRVGEIGYWLGKDLIGSLGANRCPGRFSRCVRSSMVLITSRG